MPFQRMRVTFQQQIFLFENWNQNLMAGNSSVVTSVVRCTFLSAGKKSRVSIISALSDTSCCRLTGNESPHELFQPNPH